MREISFRAKAINRVKGREYRTNYNNGDWVYGLITKLHDEEYNLPAEMRDDLGINGIEVDYKTIGQYIGIEDKNETSIFEGDIIQINDDEDIYVIEYSDDDAAFEAIGQFSRICYDFNVSLFGGCVEVVGNIHDNPELLEE